MVVIGIDSHKQTLACCAVDEVGRETASKTFANDPDGHRALVRWALRLGGEGGVEYGVESAFSFARRFVELLLDQGAVVFDVPPKLVERSRRRRGIGKSDVIDAREIARATLRERERLTPLRPTRPVIRDLKLLVEYHGQLGRERTQTATRLHADLLALLPGYQTRVAALDSKRGLRAAEQLLGTAPDGVQQALALARLRRLVELDAELAAAKKRIATAVEASGSGLVALPGLGVLTAARILAEVRDVRRFATPDAFARVNGTAPIPASSGQRDHHRLNRGGNRRLNYALHIMAFVQARCDPRAKAYIDKQRAAGKTYRDAIRCLKRRLSDVVWRQLVADLETA